MDRDRELLAEEYAREFSYDHERALDAAINSPSSLRAMARAREEAREAALPALQAAAEALMPFASWARSNTDTEGWAGLNCQGERIRDWFGPSDFRIAAQAAEQMEAAIRSLKGGSNAG